MKSHVKEGEGARDHMAEALAHIDNPLGTEIDGWFPAATAPRDGTLIRVRHGKWSPCHARYEPPADGLPGYWRFVEFTYFEPTLWQPSPTTGEAV